jgi:hypothetical protein
MTDLLYSTVFILFFGLRPLPIEFCEGMSWAEDRVDLHGRL